VNIFFDVDDTIVSGWWRANLRPLVKETFAQLNRDGHCIYIWSGVGLRWADIDTHCLREYIMDCFVKPLTDYQNALVALGIYAYPQFVVDDHVQIVDAFGGYVVRPYVWPDEADREMSVVYARIVEAADRNYV
jgi:hypothetical protein